MKVLARLGRFALPYWYLGLLSLALVAAVAGLALVTPLIIRWIIDSVIEEGRWHLLIYGALAVVAVAILQGVLSFAQRYSMEYAAQRVTHDLRNHLYRHLQELSFSFYDKAQTGQLMSRLTADVELTRRFIGFGLVRLAEQIFTFTAVLVLILTMHWKLTLLALLTFPLLAHSVMGFATKVRPAYVEIQQQLAQLTAVLQENVTGMRVVKAFAREEYEANKFNVQNWGYLETNLTAVRLRAFYMPYMNFLSALGTTIVLWYGGREVIATNLTLGQFVAFNSLLLQLIMPVRFLGWLVSLAQRGAAAGERIFEVLDTEPDVQDSPDAVELPPVEGRVVFDDVTFGYSPDKPVLRGISIVAEPGDTVAVLGGTGSGKSTLVNLVPRFYDVQQGRISIDGHDVRDLTLDSLRPQIGIVSQETFLFAASLRENIAYGKPRATMKEITTAAKAAHIHDFIENLPRGYDTEIGERGVGLSGGQKQRVAIARALVTGARILIMDESTSSVDTEMEYRIQQALDDLMADRTSFIIAQRLSTVRKADKILVLEDGVIAQEGSHQELLAQEGPYRAIYEMQFRGQEEPGSSKEGGASDGDR